jgi:hypothetical protein
VTTTVSRALTFAAIALTSVSFPMEALGTVERLSICFNYGCRDRQAIEVVAEDLDALRGRFDAVTDSLDERDAIGAAVAALYRIAARQSPIWRDRGGNVADDDTKHGRMDCIDHSTNTTTFLRLLARLGWLRFHAVGDPVERGWVLSNHRAATIRDRTSAAEYTVDSWFFDPGVLPVVYPLKEGLDGRRPSGASILSTEWTHRGQP